MRAAVMIAAAGLLAGVASADITLRRLATVDLLDATANPTNGKFIGSNPATVAWDGRSLWVGGYLNGIATNEVGIVKVSDVLSAPSIGDRFGVAALPSQFRGYRAMTVRNGVVYSGLEGGAALANGVAAWDSAVTTPASPIWGNTERIGVLDYDPGFNASGSATGSGVGYGAFLGGRRALLDPATGAVLQSAAAGPIFNDTIAGSGTVFRGADFDSTTGDLWLRKNNWIQRADRTGENAFNAATIVLNPQFPGLQTNGASTEGQNVQVIRGSAEGDFILFNDRRTGGAGQSWAGVFKAIDASGNAINILYEDFDPAAASNNGNAWYDYDYDAATQTLAVSDFLNKRVHIFAVPAPGTGAMLALGGVLANRRRRR